MEPQFATKDNFFRNIRICEKSVVFVAITDRLSGLCGIERAPLKLVSTDDFI